MAYTKQQQIKMATETEARHKKGESYQNIAAEFGVTKHSIWRWIKLHGIKKEVKNTIITHDQKANFIKMVRDGMEAGGTRKDILKREGVSDGIYSRWLSDTAAIAEAGHYSPNYHLWIPPAMAMNLGNEYGY